MRKWLNNEFYNEFRSEEKEVIATVDIANRDNAKWDTPAGKSTEDKIFLLSVEEAKK